MRLTKELLKEIDEELTLWLRDNEGKVMDKIKHLLDEDYYSFQRFNGKFGGKNNTYVDSVMTQFVDFNDFYSQWLDGLIKDYERRIQYGEQPYHGALLMKHRDIEEYVRYFLQRNFFRNLNERTRQKLKEQLWALWFGYQVIFGLLIAPRYSNCDSEWQIAQSEIRRTNYKYWTIGHVFEEGLIDKNATSPMRIPDIQAFKSVYQSIFKKLSNSKYEKFFYDAYINYLERSENLKDEPLLIPEVRYGGLDHEHKYRLDFTILNSHTFEYIGVEISPSSSHMKVTKLKAKQNVVNEELSQKWTKEMQKRNDYFHDYGITTITFTDHMLLDMESCWKVVQDKISARSVDKKDKIELLRKLQTL